MNLLPTTLDIADWLDSDEVLDTEEKVCAMIEHIALMATYRAAAALAAACPESADKINALVATAKAEEGKAA